MKRIVLTGLVLSFSALILAKPVQPVSDKEHESNCRSMMDIAYTIMEERQKGMSLKEMLDRNDRAFEDQPNTFLHDSVKMIARDAFKQLLENDKKKQLNDFSAKYYLGCMEMYE